MQRAESQIIHIKFTCHTDFKETKIVQKSQFHFQPICNDEVSVKNRREKIEFALL